MAAKFNNPNYNEPPGCPFHLEHENRISRLEEDMGELKDKCVQNNNRTKMWVALFTFLGIIVSTAGSLAGTMILAYFNIGAGG
jgi:hypothetical protein